MKPQRLGPSPAPWGYTHQIRAEIVGCYISIITMCSNKCSKPAIQNNPKLSHIFPPKSEGRFHPTHPTHQWPSPNPSANPSRQIGSSSQLLGKIKKCAKPPTSECRFFFKNHHQNPSVTSVLQLISSSAGCHRPVEGELRGTDLGHVDTPGFLMGFLMGCEWNVNGIVMGF